MTGYKRCRLRELHNMRDYNRIYWRKRLSNPRQLLDGLNVIDVSTIKNAEACPKSDLNANLRIDSIVRRMA